MDHAFDAGREFHEGAELSDACHFASHGRSDGESFFDLFPGVLRERPDRQSDFARLPVDFFDPCTHGLAFVKDFLGVPDTGP